MSKNFNSKSSNKSKPLAQVQDEDSKVPKESEFDDDLSNVSLSEVDEGEEEHINETDGVNSQIDEMITRLRKYFDENSDTVLPSDPEQLRLLLENLTSQVKNISETYSQNLQSMTSINKRLKFQAKDYYDRYKELKKTFDKERREFQMKKKVIQCEEKLNQDESDKIGKEIAEVKNELEFFQKKLGMNQDSKDDETEIMIDILKSLKEKKIDIYERLSKDQAEFINEILNEKKEDADASNDSIEGEKFAKAIEDIANRIYNQNLIPNIKIEQIETNVYSFNDKEVSLILMRLVSRLDILDIRTKTVIAVFTRLQSAIYCINQRIKILSICRCQVLIRIHI